MLFSLATTTYDLNGSLVLHYDPTKTNLGFISRRVFKTKALNSKVSVLDSGYAAGDRDFVVAVQGSTRAIKIKLENMLKSHVLFTLGIDGGSFTVKMQAVRLDQDNVIIISLIGVGE